MTAPEYDTSGATSVPPITTAANPATIQREARRWIGTPFHHRASLRGVGTDCLGLIRGVWRALYADEPEVLPDYAPDWAEATGRETLLDAARRHLVETTLLTAAPIRGTEQTASPGDVLLFRLRRNGPSRHTGILAERDGAPTLIHAWSGHAVAEVPLFPIWAHRITHAFRFPARPR